MPAPARYDLVIFGSGFAAYEAARASVRAGRRVGVIERGGGDLLRADPDLSRVPVLRDPVRSGGFDFGVEVPAAFEGVPRYIGLGGTSELWSGKWRRLDRVDLERTFEGRAWLVGCDELAPWYDVVAADYGWPDWSGDQQFPSHHERVAAHGLRLIEIYEQVPPVRLRGRWDALAAQGHVDVLTETQLVEPAFDADAGRLRHVVVQTGDGRRSIEGADFLVACGGIESIHVSHALRSARPGADLPALYPGFADHPKAFIGELVPRRASPLLEYLEQAHNSRRRLLAFGLPDSELLDAGIGNHTVFVVPSEGSGDRRQLRLMISLEQFPEAGNFITSVPTPAVSWHVSTGTVADCRSFLDRFIPRLESLVGPVELGEHWQFRGASHHAAALPMGLPGAGHVDAHCRFHDLHNLYCVSSAVFPVAGSANPTMTVVTLARRLAERLSTGSTGSR